LDLETVPGCTTFKSSTMVNTRQTGNACQSNSASSVPSNPWVHSIASIMCASTLGYVEPIKLIVKMQVIIVLCIYIFFYHFSFLT
jgi:hypothetical protein